MCEKYRGERGQRRVASVMNHTELHSLMGTQAQLSHTSPALGPIPRAIAGDHSPPTVPRNILSTDLLLAPDREPGYEMRAAGLPADGGSAIGAHPAEAPGFAIPALVFLSKTPWRSCALVPLTPDFHEHRRAPVQRAGK